MMKEDLKPEKKSVDVHCSKCGAFFKVTEDLLLEGDVPVNDELVKVTLFLCPRCYDMNIMKITAGISAEQRVEKDAKVKLGLNAAVETSSLIPGATLKLAWADAKDVLDADPTEAKDLGKITASIKMTF